MCSSNPQVYVNRAYNMVCLRQESGLTSIYYLLESYRNLRHFHRLIIRVKHQSSTWDRAIEVFEIRE